MPASLLISSLLLVSKTYPPAVAVHLFVSIELSLKSSVNSSIKSCAGDGETELDGLIDAEGDTEALGDTLALGDKLGD